MIKTEQLAEALYELMMTRSLSQGLVSKENFIHWADENEACKEDWRAVARVAASLCGPSMPHA